MTYTCTDCGATFSFRSRNTVTRCFLCRTKPKPAPPRKVFCDYCGRRCPKGRRRYCTNQCRDTSRNLRRRAKVMGEQEPLDGNLLDLARQHGMVPR